MTTVNSVLIEDFLQEREDWKEDTAPRESGGSQVDLSTERSTLRSPSRVDRSSRLAVEAYGRPATSPVDQRRPHSRKKPHNPALGTNSRKHYG